LVSIKFITSAMRNPPSAMARNAPTVDTVTPLAEQERI
jgi:hypothetical protein